MAENVCMELFDETREEVSDLVHFTKTTHSYYVLMNGFTELLISGECNDEVLAERERLGFEYEKTPFVTDAFVFVVNEDNPVDSINVDEARRIYTGEITNWPQLGGEDMEIIPFQRNQGAGSQTLIEKLVMQGELMMEAPTSYVAGSMGQLMEVARSCDGSLGAIGYSVYYYAEEMKMTQGLKLLALDGLEPEPETIRSGSYPLTAPYYVVIPSGAPECSAVRELYNYLLSEPGRRLAALERANLTYCELFSHLVLFQLILDVLRNSAHVFSCRIYIVPSAPELSASVLVL